DITLGYEGLRKHGVYVLNGEAVAVDSAKKIVTFGRGSALTYDRLVLSPGVDFLFDEVQGYAGQERIVHAWKAGPQTVALRTEFDTVKGDVLNVVPPQRAADIAVKAGLITHNNRWCDVDWRTMESKAVKGIHVLGDATLSATGMPKSGHMANSQAKVCAAALVELLNGREPNPNPVMNNTCYSFVSDKEVIHVASVHQYDAG